MRGFMDKKRNIEQLLHMLLSDCCADYTTRIVDEIIDRVVEDVEECADPVEWNIDGVRLAVGRVFMQSLNLEC